VTDITNPAGDAPQQRTRLSKEERRALLARIEREASKSREETHEKILQRAEQALQEGKREQARRLADHLDKTNPKLMGLSGLHDKLDEAQKAKKQQANVTKAEELLLRYIQERHKQAAEFALEALSEVAPHHPRLAEYQIWVRDIEEEAAHLRRLDDELAAGRTAIQGGDLATARRHLATLKGLDKDATATSLLASDIDRATHGEAMSADIEAIKQRFDSLLSDLRIEEAEAELELLAAHELPKITSDQLRLRLDKARASKRDQAELELLEQRFTKHLAASQWHQARDLAQELGQRFRGHPRAAEMFHQVAHKEADERRQESTRQGTESLEKFIVEGRRQEAELALKLLQGKADPDELARYETRVRAL
jgi:hypothetical protein